MPIVRTSDDCTQRWKSNGFQVSITADDADANDKAILLNNMAQHTKPVENNCDQCIATPKGADFLIVLNIQKESSSLIQTEVWNAAEHIWQFKMRNFPQHVIKKSFGNAFRSGYWAT